MLSVGRPPSPRPLQGLSLSNGIRLDAISLSDLVRSHLTLAKVTRELSFALKATSTTKASSTQVAGCRMSDVDNEWSRGEAGYMLRREGELAILIIEILLAQQDPGQQWHAGVSHAGSDNRPIARFFPRKRKRSCRTGKLNFEGTWASSSPRRGDVEGMEE